MPGKWNTDTYAYSDCNSYSDTYRYSDCHGHGHGYSFINAEIHAYAETSSHTSAETIV